MRELFVYYRVDARHAARAMDIVGGWQLDLCTAHAPLQARLLKRPADDAAANETWMETYAMEPQIEPAGVSAGLQADIEREAARHLTRIDGERHVEVFVACAS